MNVKKIRESELHILGYIPYLTPNSEPNKLYTVEQQLQFKHFDISENHLHEDSPKIVSSEGNTIAFIDCNGNGWLIIQTFKHHVSLSSIIKKKIFNITLGEKYAILRTKKQYILLNWGAKKLLSEHELQKMQVSEKSSYDNFFQAYNIKQCSSEDIFYVSTLKKIVNTNKLYKLCSSNNTIIAYPSLQKFTMSHKILGLSASRTHCLCWDSQGSLFSWGNRSLALGYEDLPDQDYVTKPCQIKKIDFLVATAVAAFHYSLALSSDGTLYQWGKKMEVNEINQELIFEPRPVAVEGNRRLIALKGKRQRFGAVSSLGQLYIWGENMRKLLPEGISLPINWQHGRIFQPVRLQSLLGAKIADFSIEENYISVITTSRNSSIMMIQEGKYWGELINRIRQQWLIPRKTTTEPNQLLPTLQFKSSLRKKFKLCEATTRLKSQNIDSVLWNQFAKRSYMRMATEQNEVMNYVMKNPKKHSQSHNSIQEIGNSQKSEQNQKKRYQSQIFEYKENEAIKKILRNSLDCLQPRNKKYLKAIKATNFKPKQNREKLMKLPAKPYLAKLQQVQNRKDIMEKNFRESTLQKVRQNSLSFRKFVHLKLENQKVQNEKKSVLQSTLVPLLIKKYLQSLLTTPISEGREIKISNFSRQIWIQKIQKNVLSFVERLKARHGLQKIRFKFPGTYVKLQLVFKRHVKRLRKRKSREYKSIIVRECRNYLLREKIKVGLSLTNFNILKLQKLAIWLGSVRMEKMRCLKTIWKKYLVSSMKLSPNSEIPAVLLPKNVPQANFETLYLQRIFFNPCLSLDKFLSTLPIFRIKSCFLNPGEFCNSEIKPTEKNKKLISDANHTRKARVKFIEEQRTNAMGDILPYSVHFNLFTKDKNCDITVPENMKSSQQWIKTEENILDKLLVNLILSHNKTLWTKWREYEKELAFFITERYEYFSQSRWKYIVEYNQTCQTTQKLKKEKELRRLMSLTGSLNLLDEDCIPEKYLVLEEALSQPDAPKPPKVYIQFGKKQFQKTFRKYFQQINKEAKQFRRAFMSV